MARKPKYGSPTVRLGAYVPEETKGALSDLLTAVNMTRANEGLNRLLSLSETLVAMIDFVCMDDPEARSKLESVLVKLP
jgi:hypothetical protein